MLRVVFIRHSITEGNKLKRYIGTTDEPLCFEGVNLLKERKYPGVEAIFTSPMLRCKETAGIIYNGMDYRICQGFREINFGDFENKNYKELDGNRDYQRWIDSNGKLPFPNGESQEEFAGRCMEEFDKVLDICNDEGFKVIALIVHGGTIMAILNELTKEVDYYKYMAKNGEGYIVDLDIDKDGRIKSIHKISPLFD